MLSSIAIAGPHCAAEKGVGSALLARFFALPFTSSANSLASRFPIEASYMFSLSFDLSFWARLLVFSFFYAISISAALPPALVAMVNSDERETFTSFNIMLLANAALLHSSSTLFAFSFFTIWVSFSLDFCFRELADEFGWAVLGCLNSFPKRSELAILAAFSSADALLLRLGLCDLVPTLGLPLVLRLSSGFRLLSSQLALMAFPN